MFSSPGLPKQPVKTAAYHPRAASKRIAELLNVLPVVVLTGARQTGKSRLLGSEISLADHKLFTLDDIATRTEALSDPAAFVARAPKMVIDEIQRAPELLIAVKAAVDREHQQTPGRFVLTGSANLLLMKQVSESLAGRAAYITLEPMTRRELLGEASTGNWDAFFDSPKADWVQEFSASGGKKEDWRSVARRGGFPYPALRLDDAARRVWFDGYITTYLERDLRELSAVDDLVAFRRAMQAFAVRTGTPVNASAVSAELGLVARTLRRWLDLLDVSYQLLQLPAFTARKAARLRKRPKYYWNDSALAMHLSGSEEPDGVHLETLVYTDLRAWAALDARRPSLMYWRDEENREVDFVIERDGKLLAVEVKATIRPTYNDWKHLRHFVSEYKKTTISGVLLHGGDETFQAAEGVIAVPWWRVM
jgi:predicted AAA+ superfamily ATPase